jgi:Protein of unknown function, DUF481
MMFNPNARNRERFSIMIRSKSAVCLLSRYLGPVSLAIGLATLCIATGLARPAVGQTADPDVLTLANGDQLTGKLLSEANGTVTFHSDMAGDLTFTWDKIKSIHTAQKFAVIQQGQHVSRKAPDSAVPQGAVAIQDGKIQVNTGAPETKDIAQKDAQYVVEEGAYTKTVHANPGWGSNWAGSLSAGAGDIEATQSSRTFTGAGNFVRTVPGVNWMDPRNRTTAGFTVAYGSVSQPGTVTTKTNIIHGDAEHDWYLSPRLYALVDTSFDHNYSQGLDLQEIYGGGIGYVLFKSPRQELDLKGDIHYEHQNFGLTPGIVPPTKTPSKSLIGADIGDTYTAKLAHGMLFNQGLVVTPAFNKPSAYSALATAGLTFPVYKRLGFNLSALDDFLNDPAFGSKKNSFQFSAGVTYTLK